MFRRNMQLKQGAKEPCLDELHNNIECKAVNDHCSYIHNLSSCEIKA